MSSQEITIDFSKSEDFDSENCIGASVLHHAFAPFCNSQVNDCSFDVNYNAESALIVVQHDFRNYDDFGKEVVELDSREHSEDYLYEHDSDAILSQKMSSKLESFQLSFIDSLILEAKLGMHNESIKIAEPIMKFVVDTRVAYEYTTSDMTDHNRPRFFKPLVSMLLSYRSNTLNRIHDALVYKRVLHEMRYERSLNLVRSTS